MRLLWLTIQHAVAYQHVEKRHIGLFPQRCHGRGRGFESRRPRNLFQTLTDAVLDGVGSERFDNETCAVSDVSFCCLGFRTSSLQPFYDLASGSSLRGRDRRRVDVPQLLARFWIDA